MIETVILVASLLTIYIHVAFDYYTTLLQISLNISWTSYSVVLQTGCCNIWNHNQRFTISLFLLRIYLKNTDNGNGRNSNIVSF